MKNNWIKMAAAVTAVVCFTGAVQAVPVTGNIGFTGQATLDSGSVNTATEVVSWNNTVVNGDSGSFASIALNTPVTFSPAWLLNSGAVPTFWTVGGFTYDLIASSISIQQSGFLAVTGTGTVSGNSFDPTALSWSFTAQDPAITQGGATFTFSASSASTPDGGTTMMLLGGALMGLGLIKRKFLP